VPSKDTQPGTAAERPMGAAPVSRRQGHRITQEDADRPTRRYKIVCDLDPRAVEALRLELWRLASRHRVEVAEFRVEAPDEADRRSG